MSRSENGNPMRSRSNEAMQQEKPSDLFRSFRLSHLPCGRTDFKYRVQTVVPDLEYRETFPKVTLLSIPRKTANQTTNSIQFHSLDCVNRNQALKSRNSSGFRNDWEICERPDQLPLRFWKSALLTPRKLNNLTNKAGNQSTLLMAIIQNSIEILKDSTPPSRPLNSENCKGRVLRHGFKRKLWRKGFADRPNPNWISRFVWDLKSSKFFDRIILLTKLGELLFQQIHFWMVRSNCITEISHGQNEG